MLGTSRLHVMHERGAPRRRQKPLAHGLLTALHASPLLGVIGAIALYHGTGAHDLLYTLGLALIVASGVGFRILRSQIIARYQRHAIAHGMSAQQARAYATRTVDQLLARSFRSDQEPRPELEPPSLS